mmetsp:Transcript_4993/g.10772  ORF Transcript_4993/g.10772 Transcript_4993/m.10772 type:complete len:327 (+) Transcript_4993:33-1013(+)
MGDATAPSSDTVQDEVLDLTNSHLHNLEGVTISPNLKALDLTANRLKSIDPRILALKDLRQVNFRQNLLTDISAWAECSCRDVVEDVEFRDNQLTEIPSLSGFKNLRRLELSYNEIRSISPLQSLDSGALEELYVASNKVLTITGISQLTALQVLELGSNRIRKIENLETLTGLRELWLGRNRIAAVEGLSTLRMLRRISIQSNRLDSMAGFEECTALEELYLSHNGISRLEGLSTLTKLRVLDVSNNRISVVEGLGALGQLEDLWLNDNSVAVLDAALEAGLKPVAGSLTTIYLENNPAAKDPQYKAKLLALLPKLQQLDADLLS